MCLQRKGIVRGISVDSALCRKTFLCIWAMGVGKSMFVLIDSDLYWFLSLFTSIPRMQSHGFQLIYFVLCNEASFFVSLWNFIYQWRCTIKSPESQRCLFIVRRGQAFSQVLVQFGIASTHVGGEVNHLMPLSVQNRKSYKTKLL